MYGNVNQKDLGYGSQFQLLNGGVYKSPANRVFWHVIWFGFFAPCETHWSQNP